MTNFSSFWNNKRVFITGHSGFKGGWLTFWLSSMGAKVTGFSLIPNSNPNLFEVANIARYCELSKFGDIRNLDEIRNAMKRSDPEIVFHMAAQPLVRDSYLNPVNTYSTNVIGTVNILEALRSCKSIKSVVIITSDKCYENKEWVWSYRENEPMGGYDPYSCSKGCSELIVASYRKSFFSEINHNVHGVSIASARAGNVIGGGDWSPDRLIPDAIRAFELSLPVMIRNPFAVRPWQHVLEPLSGYLILAKALYESGNKYSGAWNFGPNSSDMRKVQDVIEILIGMWSSSASWVQDPRETPHEAHLLKLDCSKAMHELEWKPKWGLEKAVEETVKWQKAYLNKKDIPLLMKNQINDYCLI